MTADYFASLRSGKGHDFSLHDFFEPDDKLGAISDADLDSVITTSDVIEPDKKETLAVREQRATAFTAGQSPVGNAGATSIVGGSPERTRLLLTNLGPAVVYIGADQARTTVANGFPLAVNQTITLDTVGSVWGTSAAAGNVVAYLDQFHTAFD